MIACRKIITKISVFFIFYPFCFAFSTLMIAVFIIKSAVIANLQVVLALGASAMTSNGASEYLGVLTMVTMNGFQFVISNMGI